MSRFVSVTLLLSLAVPATVGCNDAEGRLLDRELVQARADVLRTEADSKAADRFVAEQDRQHADHFAIADAPAQHRPRH